MRTVGEVTNVTGLTRKAIRVYEERGLLKPAQRSPAGYRLFSDADMEVLQFIRRARSLGLSLDDIAEILAVQCGGDSPCAVATERLNARIIKIDQVIEELHGTKSQLTKALSLTADKPTPICRIIETGSG